MNPKPTVLLTGAAHGIGRATAIALARQGLPLGLIDYDAIALATLFTNSRRWERRSHGPWWM